MIEGDVRQIVVVITVRHVVLSGVLKLKLGVWIAGFEKFLGVGPVLVVVVEAKAKERRLLLD